jgi:hypothetical protein
MPPFGAKSLKKLYLVNRYIGPDCAYSGICAAAASRSTLSRLSAARIRRRRLQRSSTRLSIAESAGDRGAAETGMTAVAAAPATRVPPRTARRLVVSGKVRAVARTVALSIGYSQLLMSAICDSFISMQGEIYMPTSLITSSQIRAARHLANLSQPDVAAATRLSLPTIRRAESRREESVSAGAISANRSALEAAGVEFINGGQPGVRIRKPPDG